MVRPKNKEPDKSKKKKKNLSTYFKMLLSQVFKYPLAI